MRILAVLLLFPMVVFGEEPLHKHPTIQAMLRESNRLRAQEHLVPHRISIPLTKAAQDQAWYMAKTHDFEHKTKANGSPGIRAARYGYSGVVRENIGRSLLTVPEVFKWWKNSPSHWRSITGSFVEAGFGYAVAADGTRYWVAVYGSPRRSRKWGVNQGSSHSRNFIYPVSGKRIPTFLLISLSASNP